MMSEEEEELAMTKLLLLLLLLQDDGPCCSMILLISGDFFGCDDMNLDKCLLMLPPSPPAVLVVGVEIIWEADKVLGDDAAVFEQPQ